MKLLMPIFFLITIPVYAASFSGVCENYRGDHLEFQLDPGGIGELSWRFNALDAETRKGSAVFDELHQLYGVFFEDGRFLMEAGPKEGKAMAKLSLQGGRALNLLCRFSHHSQTGN